MTIAGIAVAIANDVKRRRKIGILRNNLTISASIPSHGGTPIWRCSLEWRLPDSASGHDEAGDALSPQLFGCALTSMVLASPRRELTGRSITQDEPHK